MPKSRSEATHRWVDPKWWVLKTVHPVDVDVTEVDEMITISTP